MEEIAVTHVDAHMAVAGAGAEEHQVADADIITADFFAAFQQLGGGARYLHTQAGQEGEVDEAGAIHAVRAQAAVAVWNAFPVFVLGLQGNAQGWRFGHYLCHQRIQFLLGLEIRGSVARAVFLLGAGCRWAFGGRFRASGRPAGTAGQQEQQTT